jgi:hypothetical protein
MLSIRTWAFRIRNECLFPLTIIHDASDSCEKYFFIHRSRQREGEMNHILNSQQDETTNLIMRKKIKIFFLGRKPVLH